MASTPEEGATFKRLLEAHPGYDTFSFELYALLSHSMQPAIYVHDTVSPRRTSEVISSILLELSQPHSTAFRWTKVNAVACFTTRLLYDSILNGLAGWSVEWSEGCRNWCEEGKRFNDCMDGFLLGLRTIAKTLGDAKEESASKKKKRGWNTEDKDLVDAKMVLVIERAERLKETLPDLLVPLTRLAELSRINISTIFLSSVRWEDIRPPLGVSPEPYFFEVAPCNRQAAICRLKRYFLDASTESMARPYEPSLLPLYAHFASVLYDVCGPFTQELDELAYISAARWPAFVQAVSDENRKGGREGRPLALPSEDIRIRLIRQFTPTFTAALEALYPRLTDAKALADATAAEGENGEEELSRMARYILVAAFLASTNPAKTDLRMFGRGLDERKKRKGGRVSRKGTGDGKAAKVPQRLLGPTPFPFDRLIAILGALLEENDVDNRPPAPEFVLPGEYTEMEMGRTQVYALVMELAGSKLLHRTSAPDRLDGPPTFKCGISHAVALKLARGLGVPLNDLMWHPP